MATVAEAFVTLRPDLGKFGPETEAQLKGATSGLGNFGKTADAAFDGPTKKASAFNGALGTVAATAGGFLAANVIAGAGQKIVGFFTDSISAASDLGESINAVNKIFGTSSQVILDWGDTQANSYGLSQRAFNQLATPLGAALKNMGFSQDEVADSTINLTKRASDMASVFNTTVPDALEAINSALRGEANPIERYGVSVNAAKVEMRALADTGKATASELTETEKAAARLALIFEQTESVAGDFTQTSGDLANAQRIQTARTEELQATIGQKLIPVQLAITQAKLAMVNLLITKVIPVLEELYAKHWPSVSKAIGDVVSFVETNWPKIQPIIEFAAEYVKTRIEGMLQTIKGIVQVISGVIDLVSALFHGEWGAAWEAAKQIMEGILNIMIGNVKQMFGSIPGIILGLLGDAASAAASFAESVARGVLDRIEALPGEVGGLIAAIPGEIAAQAGAAVTAATTFANDIINAIKTALRNFTISGTIGGVDMGPLGTSPSVSVNIKPFGFLKEGTNNIPWDNFAAMLHKGEAVIPADLNPFNPDNAGTNFLGETSPTVNFNGPVTIQAQDKRQAERSASYFAWGVTSQIRARG